MRAWPIISARTDQVTNIAVDFRFELLLHELLVHIEVRRDEDPRGFPAPPLLLVRVERLRRTAPAHHGPKHALFAPPICILDQLPGEPGIARNPQILVALRDVLPAEL